MRKPCVYLNINFYSKNFYLKNLSVLKQCNKTYLIKHNNKKKLKIIIINIFNNIYYNRYIYSNYNYMYIYNHIYYSMYKILLFTQLGNKNVFSNIK